MDRRSCLTVLACLPLAGLSGCATTAEARGERGKGVAATFVATFDQVWAAIPAALQALELPLTADNKAEGYVLSETGASLMSWGERIAIFVERAPNNRTKVEVVSKRAVSVNITATDWAPKIFAELDKRFKRG